MPTICIFEGIRIVMFYRSHFLAHYSLELAFDHGLQKRVNPRRELYGPASEPLKDPAFFAKAYLDPDSGTVAWPNGAGFASDFLAELEPERELSVPSSG